MFEAFKTQAEQVADRSRQMSPDAVKSYRLASVLLGLNALFLALLALLTPGPGFPVVAIGVSLLIACALYQLKSNWADAVVVISVAGTSLQTLLQLWARPIGDALLGSLGGWGIAGALVLLLTGEPGPGRRVAALAIFLLLTAVSIPFR